MHTYIANRALTWAGPDPWSLGLSPGLPWARSQAGSGPGTQARGRQPWARAQAPGALPGPCKRPVSYICMCIFYTDLQCTR